MTIRTKLIVLLAIPLAALAVVGIWAFRNVNTETQTLNNSGAAVTTITGLETLWENLSAERLAVIGNEDVLDAVLATDAALEQLARDRNGSTVAEDVVDALPEPRQSATTDEYADALDIIETSLDGQSLEGFSSDSVLRTIYLDNAREASRTQEEAWIDVLQSEREEAGSELDAFAFRGLLNDSPVAVAARQQAFVDRLSDGSTPFAGAALRAAENTLGELETSFTSQAQFNIEGVEEEVGEAVSQLSDDEILDLLTENRERWAEASSSVQLGLQSDLGAQFRAIDDARSLATFIGILGGVLLITLLFVVARSITGPLNRLMENADVVTHDRLPSAVAQLRTLGASDEDVELAPIPKESNDEIGTITDAFNDIQRSALRVATDQARSRRNVAEMFVSLGRRNQQLNQRMIAMISELEQDEQDPETLKGLYDLDNVATRMRRNAESLLVLAGNRSPRQWSKAVPFEDVVRSSLAEVEFFDRVDIGALPDKDMSGNVVADITHMFAELLDNATQFSDPTTRVEMTGFETEAGLRLEIADQGFGIGPADLAALNERLSDPPELDKAPSRLLGLFVVGRLAEQHGVYVELASSPGQGTVAYIDIPSSLLPVEVGENPIDVGAVEVNSDNASSFFDSGDDSAADEALPIDVPVAEMEDLPQRELDDLPIDVPVAEADPVEVPVAEADPVEVPVAEDSELPTRGAAAAGAAVVAAGATDGDSNFNPLKDDSWPVTQPDVLPSREDSPMAAVQREAQREAAEQAEITETVEASETVETVSEIGAVSEPESSSEGAGSPIAGLPTRMPQATIDTVSTETAVIPLDIEEAAPDAAASGSAASAFGSFAKGVEAGLDEVSNHSDEGENS